jgi:hypothetical protein
MVARHVSVARETGSLGTGRIEYRRVARMVTASRIGRRPA